MGLTRSLTKLGALFRRREIVRDIDDEIHTHIAMEMDENVEVGMEPEEARRAAHRSFGNVTLAREDSRGVWIYRWFDDFGKDLRFATRMLFKNRGFSAVAVI